MRSPHLPHPPTQGETFGSFLQQWLVKSLAYREIEDVHLCVCVCMCVCVCVSETVGVELLVAVSRLCNLLWRDQKHTNKSL